MCLIIHSPLAKLPSRADFFSASENNPDGIGIMSADGVAKFIGKRKTRRAWRYAQQIAADGLPFAVHFRWATHGRVSRANTHPFEVPGTGAHLMHNGILWTSRFSTDDKSDTRIFAEEILPAYMPLIGKKDAAKEFYKEVGKEAAGNRLLIMRADGKTFDVINRHLWTELDGILYSNTYSIDAHSAYEYASPTGSTRSLACPTASRAGWLHGPLSKGYGYPSGPTMHGEDAESEADSAYDYATDIEEIESAQWEDDYEDAIECGYTGTDAERYADAQADKRAMATRGGIRHDAAPRSGFDWHDRATWDRYPIPGTEYRSRVLNRHGDNEETGPDAVDMFV